MCTRPSAPSISLDALHTPDYIVVLPRRKLRSTPFAENPSSERFEYPFPTIQPMYSSTTSPTSTSTPSPPNSDIVPLTDIGRGTYMTSYGSISLTSVIKPLRYPPTASSVPSLHSSNQKPPRRGPLSLASRPPYRRSAAQLCLLAGTNPPIPPSLVLKCRLLKPEATVVRI